MSKPPWGFYHEGYLRRQGIHIPENARRVQIPDGNGGLVWAYCCHDIDGRTDEDH